MVFSMAFEDLFQALNFNRAYSTPLRFVRNSAMLSFIFLVTFNYVTKYLASQFDLCQIYNTLVHTTSRNSSSSSESRSMLTDDYFHPSIYTF